MRLICGALFVWLSGVSICHAQSGGHHAFIVDAHVHTSSGQYVILSDMLASTGITRFVNLSGGQPGKGLDDSLRVARELEHRIKVCVNLEWRRISEPRFFADQVELLRQAKSMGAACLKVSKALGLGVPDPSDSTRFLAVDDRRLDPVWAAAGKLALPVFIHTGDPKAFFEPVTPDNERFDELSLHPNWSFADAKFPRRSALLAARNRVFERHPKTTFVAVHFANNPEAPEEVAQWLRRYPNVFVDVAARLPELGRHPPRMLRRLFVEFQDRILFGTDLGFSRQGIMLGSPGRERPGVLDIFVFYARHFHYFESRDRGIIHPTPIQGKWLIDGLGLPDDVLTKIYRTNALRLFWSQDGPDERDVDAVEQASGMAGFME